jgi:hypothetical protein
VLKKVHRVLHFESEAWLEPYIRVNTERWAAAQNDFEKDYHKLKNNAVFGRTMMSVRDRCNIEWDASPTPTRSATTSSARTSTPT